MTIYDWHWWWANTWLLPSELHFCAWASRAFLGSCCITQLKQNKNDSSCWYHVCLVSMHPLLGPLDATDLVARYRRIWFDALWIHTVWHRDEWGSTASIHGSATVAESGTFWACVLRIEACSIRHIDNMGVQSFFTAKIARVVSLRLPRFIAADIHFNVLQFTTRNTKRKSDF